MMRIVGIDLAGSPNRRTGFCLLDEKFRTITKALHEDKEIISETLNAKPRIVSIDAPLCLPREEKVWNNADHRT